MSTASERIEGLTWHELRATAREFGVEGKTAADLRAGILAKLEATGNAATTDSERVAPVVAERPPAPVELPTTEVVPLTAALAATVPQTVRRPPQYIRVRGRLVERR